MTDPADSLWIRRYHPRPNANQRVVCFPHAGGAASYFHPLSAAMPSSAEVLAVQYPGRQDRRLEPMVDDLTVLAGQVVPSLVEWADRPLTLFGHSMGATVAFEVCRQLEQRGIWPVRLVVSGRRAPSRHRDEATHRMDDRELLKAVVALGGTGVQLLEDEELVAMVLPAIRNDYRAAETYVYRMGPSLRCPVVVMIGEDDPKVTLDEARAWAMHTTCEISLHVFPGGHFYLDQHQAALLAAVTGTE
jgi:pyochelin biosynthesis protein PchC